MSNSRAEGEGHEGRKKEKERRVCDTNILIIKVVRADHRLTQPSQAKQSFASGSTSRSGVLPPSHGRLVGNGHATRAARAHTITSCTTIRHAGHGGARRPVRGSPAGGVKSCELTCGGCLHLHPRFHEGRRFSDSMTRKFPFHGPWLAACWNGRQGGRLNKVSLIFFLTRHRT